MTEHYPYRFKTEAEFIEEFGENWNIGRRGTVDWAIPKMNYLFGIPYPYYYVDRLEIPFTRLPSFDGWSISWDMLTENKPITPDYTPRRKK